MNLNNLFIILGLSLLLFGCLGQPSKPAGGTNNITTNITKSIPLSSELELDIRTPKATYRIGEQFSGEYYMRYNRTPFEGIVFYCEAREGFKKKYCSMTRGTIGDVDFDNPEKTRYLKVALQAFKLNNESGYSCCVNYFYDEGRYTYSISVYSCLTIERELNKSDCGGELRDIKYETLINIQPFKSESKDITVAGGQSKSECKTSADCKIPCEGCKEGKQICEQGKEICIDCFADLMCKSGYKCEQYKCVIEK